ncbi:MAG: hypothetical protein ABMA15_05730 [Vicinamibacterales bacterium]|jgi:acyl carrier protein
MVRLVNAIKTVFPEFDDATFSNDMEMLQIPGWDSMNSVNLQMQIQSDFDVSLDQFVLNDESKVSEIVAFLKSKKVALKSL